MGKIIKKTVKTVKKPPPSPIFKKKKKKVVAKTIDKVKSDADRAQNKIASSAIRGSSDKKAQTDIKHSTATFSRSLSKLRKLRADGEIDAAYQREVLKYMFESTNRLVGICEKVIHNNPESIKGGAYSYNALISQSREIMHDLRMLEVSGQQADKLIALVQGSMANIVQSLVDISSIYRIQITSRLKEGTPTKEKINKDLQDMLKQTAKVLNEHYKGLESSIVKYYEIKK